MAVLAGPWPRVGVVVAALLAAATILARTDRQRAWAMLGALVLAPVLLLDDVWHSAQLGFVHRHPLDAAVAAAVGLAVLAGAAYVVRRRPWIVAPAAMLTLPFRIPISSGGNTNSLLVPLYFVIAASALAWLVPVLWQAHLQPSRTEPEPRRSTFLFEKLLAAFVVLYALQSLYSPSSGSPAGFVTALQNEVFFYIPFAILLARLRDIEWNRDLIVRCLLVTVGLAIAFSLIGFLEEATRTLYFRNNLVQSNALHEYFTINSVFYDPDIFGRYLALTMLLVTTVLLYEKHTRVQLGAIVTLAILWTCLVFTLSRSSLVALALGLAVLAALRWRARPVIYLGVVALVLGGIIVAIDPKKFGLQNTNVATSGRANLVNGGIQIFEKKPLYGFGSGSFPSEYTRYDKIAARSVKDSHNIPITIGVEQGLIGEVLYIALVISALLTLFKGARGDPVRVGIAAAFLGLMLHTMLYADFLEDPVSWTLLAVGGSLAIAARSARVPEDSKHHLHAVA
ncbi:MAG TPA: O-antigen ligase family protein [Solirubrobacteraceae bacterium]|nr:O-antigen ligase family protein [Solirubrobacteraceae bacterium]